MTQGQVNLRPLPQPDKRSAPFWDAAKRGVLAIQQCQACRYYNHPPRPFCDRCLSTDLEYAPVSGNGTIYTYTIMHGRNVQGFETRVPYVNLVVELDEQPGLWLIANLLGGQDADVAIGKRVRVAFEEVGEGVVLPQFRLVEARERAR